MRPGQIRISRNNLGARLNEAAAIKRRMTELLAELEALVADGAGAPRRPTGKSRPGGWRHNPLGWARRHKTKLPR
jgi:hypothetical protein